MSEYACVCMFIIMMPPNHFQEKKFYLSVFTCQGICLSYLYVCISLYQFIYKLVCLSVG